MYELKIYRGVLCHDNGAWNQIWRGIDLSVQNWHGEFDTFWPEHSKISKIYTLLGCFWPKYITFELKKYRGGIFHGTVDWCKIWSKTDLCFLKIFVYRLKDSDFILESKIAELNWKQNLYWFFLKISRMFPIFTSRNRLMNTLLIVLPYRQSIDRNLNILLMVNINPIKKIV